MTKTTNERSGRRALADYVQRARSARGLSLRALADLTGGRVSHSTLARIENVVGPTGPEPETIEAIAEALERPYAELWRVAFEHTIPPGLKLVSASSDAE